DEESRKRAKVCAEGVAVQGTGKVRLLVPATTATCAKILSLASNVPLWSKSTQASSLPVAEATTSTLAVSQVTSWLVKVTPSSSSRLLVSSPSALAENWPSLSASSSVPRCSTPSMPCRGPSSASSVL